jgi:hypothetical protein
VHSTACGLVGFTQTAVDSARYAARYFTHALLQRCAGVRNGVPENRNAAHRLRGVLIYECFDLCRYVVRPYAAQLLKEPSCKATCGTRYCCNSPRDRRQYVIGRAYHSRLQPFAKIAQ